MVKVWASLLVVIFFLGEIVTRFKGPILYFDQMESGSYEGDHCLQVGERVYLGPDGGHHDFINHSCEPNTGFLNFGLEELGLVALRLIREGEELTWDYSTSMDDESWEIDCLCGSSDCRKRIRDFKFLPPELQEKYLQMGIVLDFIAQKYQCRRRDSNSQGVAPNSF